MLLQRISQQNLINVPFFHTEENVMQLHKTNSTEMNRLTFQQFVCVVGEHLKSALTVKLLAGKPSSNTLIYVRTNSAADSLAEYLNRAGVVAESIHGNKSQRTKLRTLTNFKNKSTSILVATESAASVVESEVATIINFDLPLSAETYKKRIGCHIAGDLQKVISFCDVTEQSRLSNINRAFPGEVEVLEHNIV